MNILLFLFSACTAVVLAVVLADPLAIARENAGRDATLPLQRSVPSVKNLNRRTGNLPSLVDRAVSGITRVGNGTYYLPGLGACGQINHNNELVVAVAATVFDNFPGATKNPNKNPICNRMITAQYQPDKGNDRQVKTVVVKVVDRCQSCKPGDLDFSEKAFTQLAHVDKGRIQPVRWTLA